MNLGSLLFQSGLHFARRLDPYSCDGFRYGTPESHGLGMGHMQYGLTVYQGRPVLGKNVDDLDVKRLCSEVLGSVRRYRRLFNVKSSTVGLSGSLVGVSIFGPNRPSTGRTCTSKRRGR